MARGKRRSERCTRAALHSPKRPDVARQEVDLSRFDAAPLIAFTATKETNYGHGKNG